MVLPNEVCLTKWVLASQKEFWPQRMKSCLTFWGVASQIDVCLTKWGLISKNELWPHTFKYLFIRHDFVFKGSSNLNGIRYLWNMNRHRGKKHMCIGFLYCKFVYHENPKHLFKHFIYFLVIFYPFIFSNVYFDNILKCIKEKL